MICGTRGSPLALAQTEIVLGMLGGDIETRTIKTSGDVYRGEFGKGGATKGLFTKEIDQALSRGVIDFAVHSMKDVQIGYGFHIVVPKRGPPADTLVTRHPSFEEIPEGGRIGTGSPRRATELRRIRPDLEAVPIRGNVGTRMGMADELDGVVIAEAGLERLGLWGHGDYTYIRLPPEEFIPAACQGALAVACRKDDAETMLVLERIRDDETTCCVMAEREVMEAIGGNCHVPAGAWARMADCGRLEIAACINDPAEGASFRDRIEGAPGDWRGMARALAGSLLSKGADKIVGSFP